LTLRALHGSYVLTYPAWDTRLSYAYRNVHQWIIQERRKNEADLLVQSTLNGGGACIDPVNGRSAICFSPGAVSLDRTETALGSAGGTVTAQVTLASDTPGASFTVSGNGCAPGAYNAPQTLVWVAQQHLRASDADMVTQKVMTCFLG
jgi:hypothetical protein